MKIRSVGVDLFHADGRKDKHDEANSSFSQFCERPYTRTLTCRQMQNSHALRPQ